MLDYVITGAGPAGLQCGYFLHRAGHKYRILEAGSSPGTFFERFPRHRTLLSINKVHTGFDDTEINLRWDWNSLLSDDEEMQLKKYTNSYFPTAEELCSYLEDFAQRFDLKIDYGVRVARVKKEDVFIVQTGSGESYRARRLIVATGVSRPCVPPIPGIEWTENYFDVSVDSEEFAGQRVLIIGKGNSGFETADNLIPTAALIHLVSPSPIQMAWKTHYVGHLRAINNSILDSYQLKSQNAVLDATVDRIERDGEQLRVHFTYTHAHGETEVLVYDRIITCTGFAFDDSIFDDSCRPRLTLGQRYPAQTSEWESTNIKDLYFAGTLTQVRDYKKTTSAFIHGFRYNARALFRILQQKYHGIPWLCRSLDNTPEALRNAVIDRVNRSSGLWQQFGFLADLIVISDDSARYYEELPVDYIHSTGFGGQDHSFVITLEYGDTELADPFNVVRIERNDVEHADQSHFLHPIVRHYRGRELLSEHHVIEDLAAEWTEEVHLAPLLEFFGNETAAASENMPRSVATQMS